MGNTPFVPRCRHRTGRGRACSTIIRPRDLTGRTKDRPVTRRTLYRTYYPRPHEYRCPGCGNTGWTTHPSLAREKPEDVWDE